ncbi:MAG: nucleotidyltransferase family protein [Brevundimonas sp.]|nr:MAG: nucleotidyltransferase family protein [Brevundimonas sp.]
MVLAAGLGTRMRPLTDDRPKALVEVAGRALIDHVLDRLAEAGVETAVVNVHWFADRLESHLAARGRGPDIVISDERETLLETGGGLKKAAPLLGADPVFFRGEAASAPFAYMGVHICKPGYVAEGPEGPFSLSQFWRRSAAAGRLYGCVLDGDWMHVGDPRARDEAEAKLAG